MHVCIDPYRSIVSISSRYVKRRPKGNRQLKTWSYSANYDPYSKTSWNPPNNCKQVVFLLTDLSLPIDLLFSCEAMEFRTANAYDDFGISWTQILRFICKWTRPRRNSVIEFCWCFLALLFPDWFGADILYRFLCQCVCWYVHTRSSTNDVHWIA